MSQARTFIHIGHSKTGSSAIQSFLALNADLLREFGIDYPWHSSFDRARRGKISAGNPDSFFEAAPSAAGMRLFSSEMFFPQLREGTDFVERIGQLGGRVTILCYTRDLFDHFSSAYGQYIKRGGGTKTAEEYARNYNMYRQIAAALEVADRLGAEVRLLNYSRIDEPIEDSFIRLILGAEADPFLARSERIVDPVNRSLTRGELEIQRLFNLFADAPTSAFISDALVNDLPYIAAEKTPFTRSMCEGLIKRNAAAIAKINARMPDGHAIRTDEPYYDSDDTGEPAFAFSFRQLESLARHIAERLNAAQSSPAEVDTIRDVALKFETRQPLTRDEALRLMRIALRGRPNGPYIQAKIKEWSEPSES